MNREPLLDARLDEAPCGYLCFDDTGMIRAANATLAGWLGRDQSSLPGLPMDALYAPGGAIFHQTHLLPVLKLHGAAHELYVSLRGSDGGTLPMLLNACRRDAPDGPRNACVLVPMRQRHGFEQELIRARQAAEASRDAKARFLSMMAHEIRTPLSAIIGLAHVLLQDLHGPLAPEQRDDLELVRTAGTDIDRLISEILRFSRAEAGQDAPKLQTVAIEDALAGAESIMRSRWQEKGIEYARSSPPSTRAVQADPMRLHQILLNLLANAADHTPAGGRVSMGYARDDARNQVRIEVRDTGRGIPADQLQRIFEPFVQIGRADRPAHNRGSGLGLAISRQFALSMHGTLEAESAPGEGSVFCLTLPLAT